MIARIRLHWVALVAMFAAVAWAIIRVGPRIPFPDSWFGQEKWPYPNLEAVQAYKRSSPIGYLLAETLHLDQSTWLVLFYFVASIVAMLLIATWVWLELAGSSQRSRGFRLAVLAPLPGLLFMTIGGYDPFTAIGMGLALFAWRRNSKLLMAAAGVYLGVQHFEQAVVAILVWTLAVMALRGDGSAPVRSRISPLWAYPGVLAGKIALLAVLSIKGVDASEGRLFWLQSSEWLRRAVSGAVGFAPVFVLSLFAGLWVIVVLGFVLTPERRRRLLLGASLAIAVAFSVITLDHTRVFVMVSIPLISILIVSVLSNERATSQPQLLLVAEAMAWIVVPMTLQGTDNVYVDPMNFLDQGIMFLQQLVPI